MAKNLLIVESPAKAKTIEKYLGSDFVVKSSYGHIRDLDKGSKGVRIEKNFEPHYVVSADKKKIVKSLKDEIGKVTEVWLATDEDREGEAISWHLCEVLGLDINKTKRIVFREITKPAIQSAIKTPRVIDKNLVDAQQARRILDRLVGFELSEVLWRKVRNKLSAGRVQSVTVKLVVEREREIQAFETQAYFRITAEFFIENGKTKESILSAELDKRLETKADANKLLEICKGSSFSISSIDVSPAKRNPAAPFITSTLQQEASRKLYFSVNRTMSTAQKLYEQGYITYMRTDSTSLSSLAIGTIADEIKTNFGEEYVKIRKYKSKSANAQEAHEAIRPTYISNKEIDGPKDMKKLYDLIWKRTIASQMASAELEKTTVDIHISNSKDNVFKAFGEVLVFDGFLKVYLESDDEEEQEDAKGILPPLKIGQNLLRKEITATEKYTRASARYTEASLVKKLEELGIGRPSTYAPTISKIMEEARGYVTKESREGTERSYQVLSLTNGQIVESVETEITGATSNRLYPSDLGMIVTDFLDEHFSGIMDFNFTADIEEQFDKIAQGSKGWQDMLAGFYTPFHTGVERTLENADRAKGKRDLGVDPFTGHSVLVQMTKYGPVVQIGSREELKEDQKPKFANLRPGQSLETIDFEEAMALFQLPRTLGQHKAKDVEVGAGRYGPYVKYDEKFISLPKNADPLELDLEDAINLILEKEQENAPMGNYKSKPITKGKGRFGPFIKWNDMFVNVPKKYDFDHLTEKDAHELIKAKVEKEANRYIQNWPEENISIENGRWGPFIRFKKKMLKIPKVDDKKLELEDLLKISLIEVKKLIDKASK